MTHNTGILRETNTGAYAGKQLELVLTTMQAMQKISLIKCSCKLSARIVCWALGGSGIPIQPQTIFFLLTVLFFFINLT